MEKKREDIDVARGIGIFLVVVGHSITKDMASSSTITDVLRYFIYTIHMPLFLLVAGYLYEINLPKYNLRSKRKYIKGKFFSLMIPYIAFSFLNYGIITIGSRFDKIGVILKNQGYWPVNFKTMIFSILTYQNHQDGHLWFCYLMFVLLCINRLFIKKNTYSVFYGLLAVNYAKYIFSSIYGFNVFPDMVSRVMHYMFIFSAGRLIYASKIRKDIANRCLAIGLVTFLLVLGFRQSSNSILQKLLIPICELGISTFILLVFSKKISEESGCRIKRKIKDFFLCIGKSSISFAIYLLHMPFFVSAVVYSLQLMKMPTSIVIMIVSTIGIALPVLAYRHIFSKIKIVNKLFFGIGW